MPDDSRVGLSHIQARAEIWGLELERTPTTFPNLGVKLWAMSSSEPKIKWCMFEKCLLKSIFKKKLRIKTNMWILTWN